MYFKKKKKREREKERKSREKEKRRKRKYFNSIQSQFYVKTQAGSRALLARPGRAGRAQASRFTSHLEEFSLTLSTAPTAPGTLPGTRREVRPAMPSPHAGDRPPAPYLSSSCLPTPLSPGRAQPSPASSRRLPEQGTPPQSSPGSPCGPSPPPVAPHRPAEAGPTSWVRAGGRRPPRRPSLSRVRAQQGYTGAILGRGTLCPHRRSELPQEPYLLRSTPERAK